MSWAHALILAVVEGITEFLPISSTGHMILTSTLFGIEQDETVKLFTVAIQLGAICSVLVLYWQRFVSLSFPFYRNIVVASLPAIVLGLTLEKHIDRALGSPTVVVISMIGGGIALILLDRWLKAPEQEALVTPQKALGVGFFQCLAMIPGISRSATTMIGGLSLGFSRKQAAEFSFFLAVPIMLGATTLKLWKNRDALSSESLNMLLFGNVIAFLVAIVVIRAFIGYLSRRGLAAFGYYRVIAGLLVYVLLTSKGLI